MELEVVTLNMYRKKEDAENISKLKLKEKKLYFNQTSHIMNFKKKELKKTSLIMKKGDSTNISAQDK